MKKDNVVPMDKDTSILSLQGMSALRVKQVDHAFVTEHVDRVKLNIVLKSCATYGVPYNSMVEAKEAIGEILRAMRKTE
jgi:hypothetical protein